MNPCRWIFIAVLAATVAGDTEILLHEPPAQGIWLWHISESKISEGAGWNPPSSMTMVYSVCDVYTTATPRNWLRTPFIPLRGAKLLDIKVGYVLRSCPPGASIHCKTRFGLYVHHADGKLPNPDPAEMNYEFVENIVPKGTLPDYKKGKEFVYHGKVFTKSKGLYLAFKDEGACISIRNFTAGYKYCPEQGRDLVMFPKTIAPADDADSVQREGRCSDLNSVNQNKSVGVCLSSGKWNITKGSECLCRKGYELVQSLPNSFECKECKKGFFKSIVSNSECGECPQHSVPNPTRISCTCTDGFYALMPLMPCETLPLAPLNASASIVTTTHLTMSWIPRNSVNRTLRYSIDCFICESRNDAECGVPCGPNVQFQPSRDNISNANLTVDGLQPGSFYLFRVYSVNELNKQEKDRDKWKYATVLVRTKDETTAVPTSRGHPSGGGLTSSQLKMVLYVGIPVVIVLVSSVIVFICVCRAHRRRGYNSPVEMKDGRVILPPRGQRLYIDPSNYEDPAEALKDFAKELDKSWIKLDQIIGGGEFGDVCKGFLTRPDEETIPVAVKTLKAGASAINRKDFMSEASIMGQFCDPNVIFLEGVVTSSPPLMIVIEFMSNGSLDNFLKKMDGKLTVQQLLGMARGVASGMKYLAEMNFVHRDLAARNVLVSESLVCKVADFGLSRELEDSAYETKGGKIPVRWTALEAIDYRKFTTASDVWSYGVVLWEIMSFSERPYWDWNNYEVIDRVRGGYRLPPPLGCPKTIHQIMLNCWHAERNKRPKFTDIVKRLDVLIRSPDKLNDLSSAEPKSPKLDYSGVTPIHDWLESIKMGQYSAMFSKAGFTSLSQVATEDELDLNDMGIKLIGHKNKIRKSLKEVKKTLSKDTAS
ncbi:ephrin type-A receptor 4-like isoform X2 [Montipora foliosa]|uniref:ephrin type-A receptor 4-like isoform X2 n=1 Tax=Montipora foliosa TaxID=591990 RepID=UPI0035F20FC1